MMVILKTALILNFDNSSRANSIMRQWVCGPQRHRHTRVGRCLLYFVLLQNHKRWKDRSLAGKGFEILITSKIVRMQSCPLTVMMLFIYQTRVWSEPGPVNKSLTHWRTCFWDLTDQNLVCWGCLFNSCWFIKHIYMLADVEMKIALWQHFHSLATDGNHSIISHHSLESCPPVL